MCMLHDHTQPECIIPGQAKCIPKSKWAPSRLGSSHNSLGKFTMVMVDDHGCQGSPPCFRLDNHGSQKITMGQGSSHSNVILLSWQTHLCSVQLQPSDNPVDLVAGAFAFCRAEQHSKAPATKSTACPETTYPNKVSVLFGRQVC